MTTHSEQLTSLRTERISAWRRLAIVGAISSIAVTGCAAATPEVPASPVATESEAPAAPESFDVHQFDLSVDATPEQIAETFAELITAQQMGNMTTEIIYDQQFTDENFGLSLNEYADMQARAHLEPIFDAQYIPTWRDVQSLQANFTFATTSNATKIRNYINTPEALTVSATISGIEIVKQSADEVTLILTITNHYDGDENDAKNEANLNGRVEVLQVSWQAVDGRLLVSDWQPRGLAE